MKRNIITLIYSIIILIVITFFAPSCKTVQPTIDIKDLSYLYNPLRNTFNPRYGIFNKSDQISVLSVKLFNNDLFFSAANPSGVPTAQVAVSVKLYNISQGRTLQDTSYYNLEIVKDSSRTEYLYRIPLKTEKGSEYVVEIKIVDKIRLQQVQAFVPFNTVSDFNRYNFYTRGHFMKNELLNPVVRKDEYFDLLYGRRKIDTIFINFYKPYDEVPYPPTMVLPEKTMKNEPDTIISVVYSDTLPIMFPRKGIFLCSIGKEINEGFTFFNFGPGFPAMTTPEDMIEPLTYLASAEEMNTLRSADRSKLALDNFWIKCGGNIDKARELIRIYYTRALYANYYFTSYKEGWRTDRGMIYLIYGPPDKLYKSADAERWGYRKPVIKSGWGTRYNVKEDYLYFDFKKKDNKFSDNDYSISRSETVVSYWDKAILCWRKGIVFRLDNPSDI